MTNPGTVEFKDWLLRAEAAVPSASRATLAVFASILANPNVPSDGLLWVADALDEYASDAKECGRRVLADQMSALADLFRDLAPSRVDPPGIADPAGAPSRMQGITQKGSV